MAAVTFDDLLPKKGKAVTFDDLQPPGLVDRLSEDFARRGQQGRAAIDRYNKGEQTSGETAIQVFAKAGIGPVMDTVGEVGSSLWSSGGGAAKRGLENLADTKVGRTFDQGLQNIGEKYAEFSMENPRAAANIESAGIVASALPVGRALTKALADDALLGRARASFAKKRTDFIQDLITPRQTPTVKSEQFAKSAEMGLNNRRTVQPDRFDEAIIKTVSDTGVKRGNSLLRNRTIIDKARTIEGEILLNNLKASKVIYSPTDMVPILDNSIANLVRNNPLIVGEGEKVAQRVAQKMQDLVKQNPGTPAGLLKARQDFDKWALSIKKGTFGDNQNAFSEAVRGVRTAANDYIAEMVPDAGVRASLDKQFHLFEASDAINSKGWQEAPTRLGRAYERVKPIAKVGAGAAALGGAGYVVQGNK